MANAGADKPARIFRDYDQAALDRELNLRGRWPEHGRFFERWARDSAAVRERLPARLDLAYGDTPAEALDLFPVPGTTAAPLLAFIHGGYWQGLDKGDYSYIAPAFAEAGIAFARLNYLLVPHGLICPLIEPVRLSPALLHFTAPRLATDPQTTSSASDQ